MKTPENPLEVQPSEAKPPVRVRKKKVEPRVYTEITDTQMELIIFNLVMQGKEDVVKTIEGFYNKVLTARKRGLIVTLYKDQDDEFNFQAKEKKSLGFPFTPEGSL